MNDTAPSALTVFRTQLPYVDRRSLSEAWFSALHVAGDGTPSGASRARAVPAPLPFAGMPAAGAASAPGRAPGESAVAGATSRRYAAALRPVDPDAIATASGVRVRAGSAPAPAAGRLRRYVERNSSLTLGVGSSRVQLLLRRDGPVLHVVALCRADDADAVRLALARAGGQLRLAGDSLRASVRVRP